MDDPALVGEGHVRAREHVSRDGLAEDLDTEHVGDELFGLTLEVRVDEGDVVVGAYDVAEGGEALVDALDEHGGGEGGADVGEFLVGGGGGEEEAFAVAGVVGDGSVCGLGGGGRQGEVLMFL